MCGLYFSQSSFDIKDINIDKIINLININIGKKKYLTSLNYLRKLRCNKFLVELEKNRVGSGGRFILYGVLKKKLFKILKRYLIL